MLFCLPQLLNVNTGLERTPSTKVDLTPGISYDCRKSISRGDRSHCEADPHLEPGTLVLSVHSQQWVDTDRSLHIDCISNMVCANYQNLWIIVESEKALGRGAYGASLRESLSLLSLQWVSMVTASLKLGMET